MPEYHRTWGGRRPATTLAVLLSCLVLGTGCATVPSGGRPPAAEHSASAPPAGSTGATARTLPRSEPTRIEIPAIGVNAPVGRVGLNADGTVEVPPLDRADLTGWYGYGPTPGELGPAVVLGHVDATGGPAVFFRLKQLRPGDTVRIIRADGGAAGFRITSVEAFPKTAFPTERVYGSLDHAALRLVTCGGTFDASRRSYRDNVIAFATFTGTGTG